MCFLSITTIGRYCNSYLNETLHFLQNLVFLVDLLIDSQYSYTSQWIFNLNDYLNAMILKFDRSLIFFCWIYIINQWIIKYNSSTVLNDHNGLCILRQRILAYHPIFCNYGVALVMFDLILGPVYTVSQVPLCNVSFRGEGPNFT